MLKRSDTSLLLFISLGLALAASEFSSTNSSQTFQFVSQTQLDSSNLDDLYMPVRIHTEVSTGFPFDISLQEDLELTAQALSAVISKFLLVKPLTSSLVLGSNNLCDNVQFSRTVTLKGVNADLALILILSEEIDEELARVVPCEYNDGQILSAAIYVKTSEYLKLQQSSRIVEIAKALVKTVYKATIGEVVQVISKIVDFIVPGPDTATCNPTIPNCATCDGTGTNCTTCNPNYYVSGSVCAACSNNCVTCTSDTVCSTCSGGFYLDTNNACSACLSACATCSTGASCDTCLDTIHTSTPSCACPNFASLQGSSCVCQNGYYFISVSQCSACVGNCATCSSSSICLSCIDTVHMATPTCACPDNSGLVSNSCACNPGYYYTAPTVCSACQSPCATCNDQTTCVTCVDSLHSSAPNCACPQPGSLVGSTCTCQAGYYFSSSTVCSACSNNCATCATSPGICSVCKDTVHMSPAPNCQCPANSVLAAADCVCNPGYFYLSTTACSACNSNCYTCQTQASNCQSCVDTVHMTVAPACACPSNSQLSDSICVCNAGYYYSSSSVCSPCSNECATCDTNPNTCDSCIDPTHMTNAPACDCPVNGTLSSGSCICNAGFYYSTDTVCSACNPNCSTCQDTPSGCLTCVDSVHMTAPGCTCPAQSTLLFDQCSCNPGYYFSSNSQCSACNPQCSICTTSASVCNSCIDPTHMSAAPSCSCPINGSLVGNSCACNPGFYFSGLTVCAACNNNCQTCDTNPNQCDLCIDPTHMTPAPACACPNNSALNAGSCSCNVGYYYSNAKTCSLCAAQCATCSQSSTQCGVCIDTTHMSVAPLCACPAFGALVGASCVCNVGYYYSTSTVCSACNVNCGTCNTSADNCLTCSDTTHMSVAPACACPANSLQVGALCVCNAGYYYDSNNVCSPCNSQCSTCVTTATNCQTCTDLVHASAPPGCTCPNYSTFANSVCSCNTGYFYSADTVCSACQNNCGTCVTTLNNCVTCADSVHMSNPPTCTCPGNSVQISTNCVCNAGYYYSTSTVCSACNNNCATCTATAGNCLTCQDTVHSSGIPNCACPSNSMLTGSSCVCNGGYYYSSITVCSSCSANCATCQNSASNCLTCIDTTHMNSAPNCNCPNFSTLTSGSCTCNNGYYYSSNLVCSICSSQCSTCVNSNTNCLTCVDTVHMSSPPSCNCPTYSTLVQSQCVCNAGYYYSNASTCTACPAPCNTCSSATTCTLCDDSAHMSLNNGVCTCRDPNATFDFQNLMCVCNSGYYNNGQGSCFLCSTGCGVCTSASQCLSCYDSGNTYNTLTGTCSCTDENAVFNSKTQTCQCSTGFYLSGTKCMPCGYGCSTCSSKTSCTTCFDPQNSSIFSGGSCRCNDPDATFNSVSGTCVCADGYWNNDGVCATCPVACNKCYSNYECTSCFDPTNTNIVNGVCLCRDAYSVFDATDLVCGCTIGYYSNLNGCSSCATGCQMCSDLDQCYGCYDTQNTNIINGYCKCKDINASIYPGSTVCSCNPGYFGTVGVCASCGSGCSSCKSANVCNICFDSSHMSQSDSGTCVCVDSKKTFDYNSQLCVCALGYYSDANNNCSPCDATCANCIAFDTCLACQDPTNTKNNQDGSCSCLKSSERFSLSTGTCVSESGSMGLSFAWISIVGLISFFLS